ncbi:hypothetical protein GCM10025868_23690 [Angustibacter aerolatus]|uniref:Beta-phosphoglucomutase n=1 Tax=Angustibacter aerolatus TaxID=1162965 RepID=A0ABQ6JH38_9ACTN|nr:hypothetical protein GCM10025868_23690 [Angustibacter aerolatus]
MLHRDGVEVFEGSRRYLAAARDAGLQVAVVSSSANTKDVLEVTHLEEYVQARVDGVTLREEHLRGKPAPDSFLRGAELLGVGPDAAAVFEDATSGVAAGRAGGFAAVIGVDRVHHRQALLDHGATTVVDDLAEPAGRRRVIRHGYFPVEPWNVREPRLDLDLIAQTESVFALSNGHVGLRGNLDEGEPNGLPGTYLGSYYETRPLPYAEAGYGYPEDGQTLVNVTNGKVIRLLVDDEPFDVRYGDLLSHERDLDLRAGTLRRDVHWRSPAGKEVRLRTTRLVSFDQRSVAAIEYVVEVPDDAEAVRLVVQSELEANEDLPVTHGDPRVSAVLTHPLDGVSHEQDDLGAVLLHRTKVSDLLMGAAMDHEVEAPTRVETDVDTGPDWARTTITCEVAPGQRLRIIKYLAYGWSSLRSRPAVRDQVAAAITGARYAGWQGLVDAQRAYLDAFWENADVEVEGDAEPQQAVRFGLFHVLQASARTERRAIAGKGLTGPGYDGHAFWDTEGFVLPLLTYTLPHAAADALRWRSSTLEQARDRAEQARVVGHHVPLAHDRRPGVLGVLAGRHRRVPRERRHRRRVRAVPAGHRRRHPRDRRRPRGARRDGPHVGVARAPRPARRLARRRRHRPGRVHRGGARQRLHEPDGGEQPGARRRGGRAAPGRRPPARRHHRRDRPLARLRRRGAHPVRRGASACTRSARGSRRWPSGTSRRAATTTRCCCTSPTCASTRTRSSSRPTWCWRCTGRGTRSPPSRRRATSTTTSAAPCATRRCRRRRRR